MLGLIAAICLAQQTSPASPQKPKYEIREDHDPNGIGVFYMGREIAMVMGHEAAGWLDRPERFVEEAPQLLISNLGLQKGMVVADIGAGSGYLSFPVAQKVGTTGKVLAVDIQPEMLDIINEKKKSNKIANVETVLGTPSDPKLPTGAVDLIFMVDVYHEFDKPYEMTENMIKGLKKGGKLVFVEYRKEDPSVPIKEVHKMSVAQVKKEMAIWPMKYVKTVNNLPRQHVIIFEKL